MVDMIRRFVPGKDNRKKVPSRIVTMLVCLSMVVSSACFVFADKTGALAGEGAGDAGSAQGASATGTAAVAAMTEVKLGYPLLYAMNEINENGYYSGYNYEFLNSMTKHQNMEYKFVMDTWDNCMQMLQDGRIDVMGMVPKTEEYMAKLYYPDLNAGLAKLLILADVDNDMFGYRNYDAIQGKTIGLLKGCAFEAYLDAFLEENALEVNKVYYNTERQLKHCLLEGEVDLVLSTNFADGENTQAVVDVCNVPFYFAVSKASPDAEKILDMINKATNEILMLDSNYITDLHEVYGLESSKRFLYFTDAEKKYIEENPVVRVAYDNSWKPLLYDDEETGEPKGALVEILKLMSQDSGLQFEFVRADSYTEALQLLTTGKADLIGNFIRDLSWADSFKISISSPYLTLPLEQVINENTDSEWVVLPKSYISYYRSAQFTDKDAPIQYYDTVQECFDAVASGDAKCTYSTSHINNYLTSKNKYAKLSVIPLRSESMEMCIGIRKDAPKELASIVDKVNMRVSEEEINKLMIEAVMAAEDKSLSHWMEQNPNAVNAIIVLISLIVMAIILFYVNARWEKEKLLHYNKVTGIWNYSKFEQEVGYDIADKPDRPYVILHVNVSKFRFFNDTFGYGEGDKVLEIVANMLRKHTEKDEHFASLWADHFVCLLICPDNETLVKRTEAFQEELEREILKLYDYRIILKCGAYFITKEDIEAGKDINTMLQYANHSLAFSQESYKTSISLFNNDISSEVENLRDVEKDMLHAFENKEFVPYFQPKYNIHTGEMIGAEALVRWLHPTKGLIPPGKFLPHFEKTGFIAELDFYMFEQSCIYLRKWLDKGLKPIVISSNFSQLHLQNTDFVKQACDIAKKHNVPFELLEFELTETLNVKEMNVATKRVFDLKKLGFLVSIDDFGSGYSSLSVLQELKVDTIKLDRSFLKDGAPNEREYKVMAAIIKLAEDLHMSVICEGVETSDQVEILKKVHCDCAQGYYYAKPMPAADLEDLLQSDGKGGVQ